MPVPVHIVLHQGRIVAVDGGRGVIQRRQKVFLDIADIGGVVLHAVHDILNMGAVQLHKPGLYHLRRIIISGNADDFAGRTYGIHDQVNDLVKLLTVDMAVLHQIAVLNVIQNHFTITFSGSHPIRSHPCPCGGRGI